MGIKFLFVGNKTVLEQDSGNGCTAFEYMKNQGTAHCKRMSFMVCDISQFERGSQRSGCAMTRPQHTAAPSVKEAEYGRGWFCDFDNNAIKEA